MQVEQKPFTDKKPGQLVYLELGAGNGGMLLSLSEDGFRFRAVTPVRPNVQIPFAFSLDGNLRLEGSGVIEGLEEDGKSGGLRFTEVSDEFRKSLRTWLATEVSSHSGGREITPATATPLDTMEKIRQELRSGYPRPQSSPEPAQPAASPAHSAVPESSSLGTSPPISEKKRVVPDPKPEQRKFQSPRPFFSTPLPVKPQSPKPASVTSAFLKPQIESRPLPVATSDVHESAAAPETKSFPEQRPYVPRLEESFEHAWEQARQIAPPDSPHLSRAAAGSIIALALIVILGALGYNFRQEIGAIVIEIGQSISGDHHAATPAPVSNQAPDDKSDSAADSRQNSSDPSVHLPDTKAEKGTITNSTATPPDTKPAVEVRKNEAQPASAGMTITGTAKSGVTAQPLQHPAAQPPLSQLPTESASKSSEPVESVTGQDEFNIARELLRGNNRDRELPRAVNLLWVGVRKGYVPAEVTLADLFRRGDGVEKNCDQARVLLVAASKKGSSDARKMLEQIAEQGCE